VKWVAFLISAAVFAGLGFYVYEHNKTVNETAANNNGAICTIQIQLDDELFSIYQGGDLTAVAGDMETIRQGDALTSTTTVTTTLPELLAYMQQAIGDLSVIGGANCVPVVTKFPAMTPGRVKVEINYFRPYPINSEGVNSDGS
jgi:hypothetical protein